MRISSEDIKKEVRESLAHLDHYLGLIQAGDASYIKPLSVELRKLLCKGRGNGLLERLSKECGINLDFQVRALPVMPPSYRTATLDEYLDEFRCHVGGETYTRRQLIHIVADKKGAHTEDEVVQLFEIEKYHSLPVYDGRMAGGYPITVKYLLDITLTILRLAKGKLDRKFD